ESGNPAGRPRGIVNRATALAQTLLSERAEGIARKVIALAEEGDMAAIRVCMERLVPPVKHQPVARELPPLENAVDSVEAMARIAAAVAAGDLTAAEAAELATVVNVYVGALASKAFEERLTALEKGTYGTPDVGTPYVPGLPPSATTPGPEACSHAAGQKTTAGRRKALFPIDPNNGSHNSSA